MLRTTIHLMRDHDYVYMERLEYFRGPTVDDDTPLPLVLLLCAPNGAYKDVPWALRAVVPEDINEMLKVVGLWGAGEALAAQREIEGDGGPPNPIVEEVVATMTDVFVGTCSREQMNATMAKAQTAIPTSLIDYQESHLSREQWARQLATHVCDYALKPDQYHRLFALLGFEEIGAGRYRLLHGGEVLGKVGSMPD